MTQQTQELVKNYRNYTDKYFLRTKQILDAKGINPIVRYQVFVRKPGIVKGVNEAVQFVKGVVGDRVRVFALKDGERFDSCEPLMKLEGRVHDLVDLETVYLEIISGALTPKINMQEVREKAKAIYKAANGKPLFYFGARHFDPFLDEEIARICFEEGFKGASTDIGARAWNAKGIGTIPHASILSFEAYMQQNNLKGNPTVEAAKAFDEIIASEVPRIVLVDTYNREITDSIATARAVPNLKGVRIDTCGENYSQGTAPNVDGDGYELPDMGEDVNYKGFFRGKGVTIAGVWSLRRALDNAGFNDLEITVSSGFNAEKTAAFVEADRDYQAKYGKPLFDSIGTGSIANPTMATSDICAYFNERKNLWLPLTKVGRHEMASERLEEIK